MLASEILPLISVIVPVYNDGRYLRQCVESILTQDYSPLEIILVDDGSVDDSAAICEEYAAQYDNVTAVHQPNRGQSSARNTGLKVCKGDYVGFVDADDYVSPVFFKALYRALAETGCPMSTVRYGTDFFDGDEPRLVESLAEAGAYQVVSDFEYQEELLYQKSWNGVVWHLCERELFRNVSFPVGLYYEDTDTTYRLAHECQRIAILDSVKLYAYRQNEEGTMRGAFSDAKLESCLRITREMRDRICEWYPQLSDAVCSRCFAINRVVFSQVPSEDKETQQILWHELRGYADTVIRDPKARKKEKLAAWISKMGCGSFRTFCEMYRTLLHKQ